MAAGTKADAEYGLTNQQWIAAPTLVTVNSATNRSTAMATGMCVMISTTDCYILQGTNTVNATANHHFLPAGQEKFFMVTNNSNTGDAFVAVIQKTSAGVLHVHAL